MHRKHQATLLLAWLNDSCRGSFSDNN